MPDDKRLKLKEARRRNAIEGINRLDQFLTAYVPEQHQHEVSPRLDRLEKVWEIFEALQEECEELDDSEESVAKNLELRAQVEEVYFRVKSGLATKLPPPTVPVVVGPSPAPAAPSTLANVKLPTISLPEFDGDFNNWLTFHDTFMSMIHSSTEISQVQKFHYLRAALKGEAANLIQSITITAINYAVAWETLVNRYSNKAILRKKHIRALLNYPKIASNNVEALHRIVDEFQRHTKVLEQLDEPVEQFSSVLIELLEDKLDDASLTAWEESSATEAHPTYSQMVEFLQKRARILETISISRSQSTVSKPVNNTSDPKKSNQPRFSVNVATEVSVKTFPICPACERQKHSIFACSVFNGLGVKDRMKVVKDKKLCRNCFRSDHFAYNCRSKYSCKHCSRRHHSMIHLAHKHAPEGNFMSNNDNPPLEPSGVLNTRTTQSVPEVVSTVRSSNANVLLTTVVLIVLDAYGQEHIARALLDTGSQPNAISERLCQKLHLPRKVVNASIAGVDSTITNAKYEVQAEIRSRVADFQESMEFLVLRKMTHHTPSMSFPTVHWNIPEICPLADPDFNTSRGVDMIIGAAEFYSLLRDGRIRLPVPGPLLVETVFGWIVTGRFDNVDELNPESTVSCNAATVPSISSKPDHFPVSRDPTGRYAPSRCLSDQHWNVWQKNDSIRISL